MKKNDQLNNQNTEKEDLGTGILKYSIPVLLATSIALFAGSYLVKENTSTYHSMMFASVGSGFTAFGLNGYKLYKDLKNYLKSRKDNKKEDNSLETTTEKTETINENE